MGEQSDSVSIVWNVLVFETARVDLWQSMGQENTTNYVQARSRSQIDVCQTMQPKCEFRKHAT
jgi:hypothetical protein